MVSSANLDLIKSQQSRRAEIPAVYSSVVQEVLSATPLLKGKHQELINNYKQHILYDEIESNDLENYVMNLENFGICKIAKSNQLLHLMSML